MAVDLLLLFSFALNAVVVAELMAKSCSLLFVTFPKPTMVAVIPDALSKVAVPVNVGEALGAFKSKAVWVATLTTLSASLVLSTFPKPTMDFEIPVTVPVKAGSFEGALSAKPGTVGASYVPLRSPANLIFPITVVLAFGTSEAILPST